MDRETRNRLQEFIVESEAKILSEVARYRTEGAAARASGAPATACPYFIGSFVSVGWLEGWSGTIAPRRTVESGNWTMTPAEEIALYTDWLMALHLPAEISKRALDGRRAGYVAEALPRIH